MIVYLDTSAFVPMLVEEATSEVCREIWGAADLVVSTRLLFIEASAALARTGTDLKALDQLDLVWNEIDVLELDEDLMTGASALAFRFGLRGYDAVHCAAGASLDGEDVVLATGDRKLLRAWTELNFNTFDPNQN